MSGHLTADEWQRITEFAETPKHRRRPEQLLPDGARDDGGPELPSVDGDD